jgi:hypothetical protein
MLEQDRRIDMTAMTKITSAMMAGTDKRTHVEPVSWTVEWVLDHYKYSQTRSNSTRHDNTCRLRMGEPRRIVTASRRARSRR